jgi:hypothetical protein
MEKEEIINSVERGLLKGYKENLLFLYDFNSLVRNVREYLLTVNVAQELYKIANGHKIKLEYPIKKFYNNAFTEATLKGDIFDLQFVSRSKNLSPKKTESSKIDIAICYDSNEGFLSEKERSKVGIELKGINSSVNLIKKDLIRLCNAMILTDKISENSIVFCISGFIRRFDKDEKIIDEQFISFSKSKENEKWKKVFNDLGKTYNNLNFSIKEFDIERTTYEMIEAGHKAMESDYYDIAIETGSVVGYIILIEKID